MSAVLIPTSTEAEWLEVRRQGITASEIAVIMGLSPYSSPYALYHQKLGVLDGPEDTEAMALGRFLEGYVCDRFAGKHPEFCVSGDGRKLYAHHQRSWQLATPDRLVYEVGGSVDDDGDVQFPALLAVLEAKTAASYDGWGDDGSDEIPVHYRCQVLWQMDVLGVGTALVACLFLHARKLRVYEITMDDAARKDLAVLHQGAEDFLRQLAERTPPDVDYRPATLDALKALHPSVEDRDVEIPRYLARRYRAACRAYKAAEQRKKLAENLIRARLGNGRRAITDDRHGPGDVIVRRDVYDAKEHVRKASTVDKLVPVNPKETS